MHMSYVHMHVGQLFLFLTNACGGIISFFVQIPVGQ